MHSKKQFKKAIKNYCNNFTSPSLDHCDENIIKDMKMLKKHMSKYVSLKKKEILLIWMWYSEDHYIKPSKYPERNLQPFKDFVDEFEDFEEYNSGYNSEYNPLLNKELIISAAMNDAQSRLALARIMVEPIKVALDYQAIGRKLLLVDELPQSNIPRYEKDIKE